MKTIHIVVLPPLALLVGTAAAAQYSGNWTPTAAECAAGADSLKAGVPRRDAWQFLASSSCGTITTAAVATATRNVGIRAVGDTSYLRDFFVVAASVQDMSVLTEAAALAESKTATTAGRAFALMVMARQYYAAASLLGRGGWRQLLGGPSGPYCRYGTAVHAKYTIATPMAADYKQRIASSADRISDDAGNNQIVRDLASCVRGMLVQDVPESVPSQLLLLEYVCENEFQVRNQSAKEASLQYEVEGTTESGPVGVDGNAAAAFSTRNKGTVRVLQNGALVASVANGGTACP